jgi:hypothetical protein
MSRSSALVVTLIITKEGTEWQCVLEPSAYQEPIRCESAEFGHKLYSSVHAASVVVDGPTAKKCAAKVCWTTPLSCRHRRRRTSINGAHPHM